MSNKFRKMLYVVLFAIIIFCTIYIYKYVNVCISEEKAFEELRDNKYTVLDNYEHLYTEENSEEEKKEILAEYRYLHDENEDLYGWIKIEDTPIDYPVMFAPKYLNFYLYKDFDKQETKSGSVFIDEYTKEDSENVIIYGHNMKSGLMFGSLKKYTNKEYYEEHKYIQFDTLYEKGTYQIISVVQTVDYPEGYRFYDHIELDSAEEFKAYIDNAKKNACYDTETTAEFGDQLITLSTCYGLSGNGRLLIIAKRIN